MVDVRMRGGAHRARSKRLLKAVVAFSMRHSVKIVLFLTVLTLVSNMFTVMGWEAVLGLFIYGFDVNDDVRRQCTYHDERCWDLERCGTSPDDFKIYIYPENEPVGEFFQSGFYKSLLEMLRDTPYITENPDEATHIPGMDVACKGCDCLEFPLGLGPWFTTRYLRKLRYWDNGRNHLLFEIHDNEHPEYKADYAVMARSDWSQRFFRAGFDITVSYRGKVHYPHAVRHKPLSQRTKYLATFKGGFTHQTRRDMIYHYSNAHEYTPLVIEHSTGPHDYADLLTNSTFGLAPRGNGLGSHRLIEVMSAGCIPVILSDNWIIPLSEMFDWTDFAVIIPERRFKEIQQILEAIPDDERERLHRNSIYVYETYLATPPQYMRWSIEILRAHIYSIDPRTLVQPPLIPRPLPTTPHYAHPEHITTE